MADAVQAKTTSLTFLGAKSFTEAGRYFKLISTINPVDVLLLRQNSVLAKLDGIEQGFFVRLSEKQGRFDEVRITTGASEAVSFVVADQEAGSDAQINSGTIDIGGPLGSDNADDQDPAGASALLLALARLQLFDGTKWDRARIGGVAGSILADPADRAGRLLGIIYGSLGQIAQVSIGGVNALQTTNRGTPYGASAISTTAPAGNTAVTLVSAASNTNGMLVHFAAMTVKNGATSWAATILAKTSAPGNVGDGDVIAQADTVAFDSAGSTIVLGGKTDQSVFVAAGKGLYGITGGASDAATWSARYTLL